MLKPLLICIILICQFFMAIAQDNAPAQDNIYLKQANIDIDNLQKSFLAAVKQKKMNKGVKDLLTRFLTIGTDSLQTLVNNDSSIPDDRKLLALNSHAYFLKAFQVSMGSGDLEECQPRFDQSGRLAKR